MPLEEKEGAEGRVAGEERGRGRLAQGRPSRQRGSAGFRFVCYAGKEWRESM